MNTKSLTNLSLNISEELYRSLSALSYSTLAKYAKGGFPAIAHLQDKQESEALTFGSVVDILLTEGEAAFNNKFVVATFIMPPDSVVATINYILESGLNFENQDDILIACNATEYQTNWKPATRVSKIIDLGSEYYHIMHAIANRVLISPEMYYKATCVVNTLKNHPFIGPYLQHSTPGNGIEFLYQQKFTTTIDDVELKMMADLLVVNHNAKVIIPFDLKTTSAPEYDFPRKYLEYRYDIQSRLYWRILNKLLKESDDFKDYTLKNFRFIVINGASLRPLVFEDDHCCVKGPIELTFKSGRKTVLQDPLDIAKELKHYMEEESVVPDGIDTENNNNLYERLMLL